MVLFSADLTVINDSIIKIGDKVSRDYIELENLQNSHKGCIQFTDMIIDFIKRKLFDYFKNKKPSYDIIFQDEDNKNREFNSSMRYLINPLCGRINLAHAIPYFSISIALQKKIKEGEYKTICGIIDNPITQETFIVEEGKGAYLNSRRIRVSSRSRLDDCIVAIKNSKDRDFIFKFMKKYKNVIITNCDILNICNIANGKYDVTILDKNLLSYELPLLLVKEAGGLIKNLETGEIIVCNDLLYSQVQ